MLRLNPPPDYEYRTVGPWWITVSHVDGTIEKPVTHHVFETAIVSFWANPQEKPTWHRTMTDARGATVIGISNASGYSTMVGTRETMDATLRLVEGQSSTDEVIEVLSMVDKVRECNGAAL